MATTTTETAVHSAPLNLKTWVLKTSIHCEGCKKKVKKILSSVPGVNTIDIDAKQHRVVVTGNVDADSLLRKLSKSNKYAELLLPPENNHQQKSPPNNTPSENKNTTKSIPDTNDVKQQPPATIKPEAIPSDATGKPEVAAGEGASDGVSSATSSSTTAAARDKGTGAEKLAGEKKPETGTQTSQPVVEVKDGETDKNGGEVSSGSVGKKKKKKGQNGNRSLAETESSSVLPTSGESPNHNEGPQPSSTSSNDVQPRHHGYSYPPQGPGHHYALPRDMGHHYAPPPPAPVYAVSYNNAQPSSSYTAAYYAPPPPQSYAYSHPGHEIGPPPPQPLAYDPYRPQPLDSFEMFSDENPNGCSVM